MSSGFELQIAGYSNYNVQVEQIVEASTWEAKPHNLSVFLQNLGTRGGWGPEAVECGLMHALTEHSKRPLDQIILIGDAPANSSQHVINNRQQQYGEAYWSTRTPDWSPSGIPATDALGVCPPSTCRLNLCAHRCPLTSCGSHARRCSSWVPYTRSLFPTVARDAI